MAGLGASVAAQLASPPGGSRLYGVALTEEVAREQLDGGSAPWRSPSERPSAPTPGPWSATLEDVEDVVAFATWIAERSFKDDQYVAMDEARAQAVLLIYELRWGTCANVVDRDSENEPILCGHGPAGCDCDEPLLRGGWDPERCARFSAYLLTYLPRRLKSWFRKELRQSGRGTWAGSRGEYVYYRTVSLDSDEDVEQATYDRGQ